MHRSEMKRIKMAQRKIERKEEKNGREKTKCQINDLKYCQFQIHWIRIWNGSNLLKLFEILNKL